MKPPVNMDLECGGFTLVEVLAAIMIAGLLVTAVAGSLQVVLRQEIQMRNALDSVTLLHGVQLENRAAIPPEDRAAIRSGWRIQERDAGALEGSTGLTWRTMTYAGEQTPEQFKQIYYPVETRE